MKLYTFFRSSASFRVRIALNHKGLKYEPAGVNLPKGEHLDSDYKSINAQGLVPALEDGGRILTQSLAIMEYLDEVHPGPKLLPADPLDRAYVRALSQIIACEIHPLNNLRTRKYISKTYKLDEEG
ncbi:MAG TPA: glutathione S-transferase N-terminal domain-containing protein, partial [Burkholderiales bacterium]|nr:glutathione S-transferase N-terminal domain-containing protein [Burkholderiales bacterium]